MSKYRAAGKAGCLGWAREWVQAFVVWGVLLFKGESDQSLRNS